MSYLKNYMGGGVATQFEEHDVTGMQSLELACEMADLEDADMLHNDIEDAIRMAGETEAGLQALLPDMYNPNNSRMNTADKAYIAAGVNFHLMNAGITDDPGMQGVADAWKAVKDWAIKLWRSIVALYDRAVAAVTKWLEKMFGPITKLKARAEALKTKADESDGTPKEANLKIGAQRKYLDTAKAASSSMNLTMLGGAKSGAEDFFKKHMPNISEALTEGLSDAAALIGGDKDAEEIKTAVNNVATTYNAAMIVLADKDVAKNDLPEDLSAGKSKVTANDPIMGNGRFYSSVPTKDGDKDQRIGTMSFHGPTGKAFKDMKDENLKALTSGEISTQCDGIMEMCDVLLDTRIVKDLTTLSKDLKSQGNDISKAMAKDSDKNAKIKGQVKSMMTDIAKGGANLRNPAKGFIAHSTTTLSAVYSFCSSSFDNLEVKGDS